MRQDWSRSEPEIEIDGPDLAKLLRPVLPAAEVKYFRTSRGGLANTNIEVGLKAAPWRVNLRLSQQEPVAIGKEASLNRLLLKHGIPTARFLHSAETNPVTNGPYAILEWMEGERLDLLLQKVDSASEAEIGRQVGAVLAAIHAIRFETHGFLDDDLRLCAAIDLGRDGFLAYLRPRLTHGLLAERLGDLAEGLATFIEREGARLDAWLNQPCLVHADFNGSNVLMRQSEGRWQIAAVLDWEFALAATPAFDFGNLLRAPLGEKTGFIDATAACYCDAGGSLPNDWRDLAKISDLYAWADVLSRPEACPGMITDGREIIRETIFRPPAVIEEHKSRPS